MNNNSRIRWITRTALFIALLIVLQGVTAPFGNTAITGSIVNVCLILSVMLYGFPSGATVALVSPIHAKIFGIGPLWSLIPFIMLGNLTFVFIWHRIGHRKVRTTIRNLAALVTAAVAKFLVLYFGIVKVALRFFLVLPAPQGAMIAHMFSLPQLFTALLGGTVALLLLPLLENAMRKP